MSAYLGGTLVDASGALLVTGTGSSSFFNTETTASVYATSIFMNTAAVATDIAGICGSATKTIRLHQIQFSINAAQCNLSILLRSSLDFGPAVISSIKHDSSNPSPTALLVNFPANPAVGALVGAYESCIVAANSVVTFNYGMTDQAIVLRAVNQAVYINLNNLAASALVTVKFKWSEI